MGRKMVTTEEFIARATKKHNGRYEYDEKTVYTGCFGEVIIKCKIHGFYKQMACNHLAGHGCPYCSKNKAYEVPALIEKYKEIHGDKYDYSEVAKMDKIRYNTKIRVYCKAHGWFEISAGHHVDGRGCWRCGGSAKKDTEQFITEAEAVHGEGVYDYSRTIYLGWDKEVEIICHEHGSFWQRADVHLRGGGCQICNQSHMEKETERLLKGLNVEYIPQCGRSVLQWLYKQSFDFYLPEYNIAIECQGEQHFRPVGQFGGEEGFRKTVERDERKARLCEENGIRLFYIRYDESLRERLFEILREVGVRTEMPDG